MTHKDTLLFKKSKGKAVHSVSSVLLVGRDGEVEERGGNSFCCQKESAVGADDLQLGAGADWKTGNAGGSAGERLQNYGAELGNFQQYLHILMCNCGQALAYTHHGH